VAKASIERLCSLPSFLPLTAPQIFAIIAVWYNFETLTERIIHILNSACPNQCSQHVATIGDATRRWVS
jgi:hypothetical protein